MAIGSTGYEPFAWRLAREGIGQSLRQRYAVAKELPPSLSTPVSKLDVLKAISCYVVRASRIKSEGGDELARSVLRLAMAIDQSREDVIDGTNTDHLNRRKS
jgi:hypothetical protein